MNFKKNLKRGQSSLEYFILLGMIALITIVTMSTAFPAARDALLGSDAQPGIVQSALTRMTQ